MKDFPSPSSFPSSSVGPPTPPGLSDSVAGPLQAYFAAHEKGLPASGLYDLVLREVERPLFLLTLAACGDNQVKAAALLGMNRNTLRKKLTCLGLLPKSRARRGGKRLA